MPHPGHCDRSCRRCTRADVPDPRRTQDPAPRSGRARRNHPRDDRRDHRLSVRPESKGTIAMKIGLGVPQLGRFADPEATRTVATAAEQAGFASLWAIDRLLAPTNPRTPYPGSPDGVLPVGHHTTLDPLVTLTLAAAVTERIRVGTAVLVAPWYPPALLARSLATL